jgi:excisionase family DNA binding protein
VIPSNGDNGMSDRLLTVAEAAEMLRTSERFPRRLIAERRIRFTRVGRHVRIPESALREFIAAGLVEPVATERKRGAVLW